jgi:hypothetical protein
VLFALHGRAEVFSGPVLHVLQYFVEQHNVAIILPHAPNVRDELMKTKEM